jgi:hypothetical protein
MRAVHGECEPMSATDKYLETIIDKAQADARNESTAQFSDLAITCRITNHPRHGNGRVYWRCNGTRITRAGLVYLIERRAPE